MAISLYVQSRYSQVGSNEEAAVCGQFRSDEEISLNDSLRITALSACFGLVGGDSASGCYGRLRSTILASELGSQLGCCAAVVSKTCTRVTTAGDFLHVLIPDVASSIVICLSRRAGENYHGDDFVGNMFRHI